MSEKSESVHEKNAEDEIVEMFAECPVCHLELMIIWRSGHEECTYCGYKR